MKHLNESHSSHSELVAFGFAREREADQPLGKGRHAAWEWSALLAEYFRITADAVLKFLSRFPDPFTARRIALGSQRVHRLGDPTTTESLTEIASRIDDQLRIVGRLVKCERWPTRETLRRLTGLAFCGGHCWWPR